MNYIAFEYEALTVSAGTDLVYELTKMGKQGWYPATLPPLQTPFGMKIILQRAVSPASIVLNEEAKEPVKPEEPRLVLG
jgi:hypothetical protein